MLEDDPGLAYGVAGDLEQLDSSGLGGDSSYAGGRVCLELGLAVCDRERCAFSEGKIPRCTSGSAEGLADEVLIKL
jgi:hypothetical protein